MDQYKHQSIKQNIKQIFELIFKNLLTAQEDGKWRMENKSTGSYKNLKYSEYTVMSSDKFE